MEDPPISHLLKQLQSPQPEEAWAEFLREYSPLILQIVGLYEREPDQRTDCFLFVCAQLCRDRFRRLRRFQPEGAARSQPGYRSWSATFAVTGTARNLGGSEFFNRLPGCRRSTRTSSAPCTLSGSRPTRALFACGARIHHRPHRQSEPGELQRAGGLQLQRLLHADSE